METGLWKLNLEWIKRVRSKIVHVSMVQSKSSRITFPRPRAELKATQRYKLPSAYGHGFW